MSLSDPATQVLYVTNVWPLFDVWKSLSPPERMNRLLGCVNPIFSSLQIPRFAASMGASLGGSDAQLDFPTWSIQMDPTVMGNPALDRAALGALAITMYHESRHGEQWYRVAQAVAGGRCVPPGVVAVNARYGVTAQQIADNLGVPLYIANDAEQKKRFFPNTPGFLALVTGWFNSIYGAGRTHREATLGALSTKAGFIAYRHLPEEADAHACEQAIRAMWKAKVAEEEEQEALQGAAQLFA